MFLQVPAVYLYLSWGQGLCDDSCCYYPQAPFYSANSKPKGWAAGVSFSSEDLRGSGNDTRHVSQRLSDISPEFCTGEYSTIPFGTPMRNYFHMFDYFVSCYWKMYTVILFSCIAFLSCVNYLGLDIDKGIRFPFTVSRLSLTPAFPHLSS